MTSRSLSITILVVVVSVLVMFFLPTNAGSFSSVNGPATAFRAMRNAIQIQQQMVRSALATFGWIPTILGGGVFRFALMVSALSPDLCLPNSLLALRC